MDDGSSLPSSNGVPGLDHRQQHHIGLSKLSHKIAKATASDSASHHRPPVYTIDKSDFRIVVQRLTGAPSSGRFSDPPPIREPKPPSSRLQKMKPPPLTPFTTAPPEISQNPLAFPAGNLAAARNPPQPTTMGLVARPAALPNPESVPPTSLSQFLLLSPTCSMQMRSPKMLLPSNSNPSLVDSGFTFSPSSPLGGLLLPSSPGFLRLPIPSWK